MNGTIKGTVTLEEKHVLGGNAYIGKGWRMLVECLSVGRAISLPALGTAASARCALASGSYSRARSQFGLPLYKFEAIQEQLAEVAYHAYLTQATQKTINGELQKGESPSALSAMWKYQSTERGRKAVQSTMDILAGAAIQEGPNNVIAETYKSMPIAITVEGANILSRSLVTFGGGLMRSHPNLKNLVDAIHLENTKMTVRHLVKMLGHVIRNFFFGLFNKYALFAFTADMALTLGNKYKKSEYISSRMADIFSIRVFESAVLAESKTLLRDYTLKRLHNEESQAYKDVIAEMPKWSGLLISLVKNVKLRQKHISVKDHKAASDSISQKSEFVEELTNYVHLHGRMSDLVKCYESDSLYDTVIEVDVE
jgi:acyl-CoA dehydrogenase